MYDKLPPEVQQAILGILGLLPTAMLARALWHRRLVGLGQRRFWSSALLWEMPTAGLCAVIGGGIASYLQLDMMASHAVVGIVGWLGPRGIEALVVSAVGRFSGKGGA